MKIVLLNTIFIMILLIILGGTFYFYLDNVSAETNLSSNDTMTVEVDLVEFTPPISIIGIEVPDYVSLVNLSKKTMLSEEVKVTVNNTGNVNVTLTPLLKDSNEKIFDYLYFRMRKTSNGTTVKQEKIGNWSLMIEKPSEGDSYNDEYFYMQLNLKSYPEEIKEDILGHRSEIIFYAMAQ